MMNQSIHRRLSALYDQLRLDAVLRRDPEQRAAAERHTAREEAEAEGVAAAVAESAPHQPAVDPQHLVAFDPQHGQRQRSGRRLPARLHDLAGRGAAAQVPGFRRPRPGAVQRAFPKARPAAGSAGRLLVAWELHARFPGIKPTPLPAPSRVFEQALLNRDALLENTIPTIRATLLGFACSLSTAFVLSMLIDFYRPLRRALFPVFIVSQTLPLVAIAPLVVLWFGFGLAPKILLVALVTFFPMLVALVQGYEATEIEISQMLQSMGAGRWRIFLSARLPSALPYFFAGLKISITYAVVGAIFAEYAGAAKGLGIYMLSAKNNFRPDLVLAAVAVSALLTLILFGLTALIQRLAMPWERVGEDRGNHAGEGAS